MEFVVAIAALLVLGVLVEAFRARTRRRFVEAWAKDRGLVIVDCRYSPFGTWTNWLTAYQVRWRDGSREDEGCVLATGFIRHTAWLDTDGSGRGLTA